MRIFKAYTLVALCCLFSHPLFSTHIVGGELYYDYIGNNQYKITLKLYRDCINGQPPFGGQGGEGQTIINILNYQKELVMQVLMGEPVVTPVPPSSNNPCMKIPEGICVEEGVYTKIVALTPNTDGYFLSHEICCRNNTILNLVSPGSQGSLYQAYIPGTDKGWGNSSPRYDSYPNIFVCSGENIGTNHSAFDPDGDSLVYSFIPAYNGFSTDTLVPYLSPYSAQYPMSSNPPLTINSVSGQLNGTPNMFGQWVICVEVKEYRNGELLSKHYRDFQYNVINCNLFVESGFMIPNKCIGSTITFTNQSYSNFGMDYHWDFGVSSQSADTSDLKNPSFTFPDTGVYIVKLVVNPGLGCSDSTYKTLRVYPPFDPTYIWPSHNVCLKDTNLLFTTTGNFLVNSASFINYFGSSASPSVSNTYSTQVKFLSPGTYSIIHTGKQFQCFDTLIDYITVIGQPTASISDIPTNACSPADIKFSNAIDINPGYNCLWDFGDGNYSTDHSPVKKYFSAGEYTIGLTIFQSGQCIDTVTAIPKVFTVFARTTSEFKMDPKETTILDPEIYFENLASGDITSVQYYFGDGTASGYMNEKHIFPQAGTYRIYQIVTNSHQCTDTSYQDLVVNPENRFWIPNCFTPNGDGLNDNFTPIIIGVKDYQFLVFNRKGIKIFSSTTPGEGWDGNYKNEICKQDVYTWKITFINELTRKFEVHTGHVTLLTSE